jgi:hypothetical protein
MTGNQNLAYGIDGIFRVYGDDYLNIKWSQTYDSEQESNINTLDPSFIMVSWERRSEEGFAYNLKYSYTGQEFNPGVGFVQMAGVQSVNGELMYGWIPGVNSRIFSYNVKLKGRRYTRLEDGKLENMKLSPEFEFKTKQGIHGVISLDLEREGVLNEFKLSDSIIIKAGEYSFMGFDGEFGTPDSRILSAEGSIYAGQFYNGTRVGYSMGPNLNISSSIRLSAMYIFEALRFPGTVPGNALNIHSVNLKGLFMFNTKLSASLLVQFVNIEEDLLTNFRLRYNPREGNDFYMVYNDYRGITGCRSGSECPPYGNKTIVVKYIHTFIL